MSLSAVQLLVPHPGGVQEGVFVERTVADLSEAGTVVEGCPTFPTSELDCAIEDAIVIKVRLSCRTAVVTKLPVLADWRRGLVIKLNGEAMVIVDFGTLLVVSTVEGSGDERKEGNPTAGVITKLPLLTDCQAEVAMVVGMVITLLLKVD